ncbi:MAG: anthranilate synthase component [Eubacteriales bacterium]|nr:anthranilate synthase component [Eubacteriales bacterium]
MSGGIAEMELRVYPNREEFCRLAGEYAMVPVMAEFLADTLTPISLYCRVARGKGPSFLLESATGGEKMARFSFIGCAPLKMLAGRDLEGLAATLAEMRGPRLHGLPFYGGAVGYFDYDLVYFLDNIRSRRHAREEGPLYRLMVPAQVFIFDHRHHTLRVVVNTLPRGKVEAAYQEAVEVLHGLVREAITGREGEELLPPGNGNEAVVKAGMTEEYFHFMVEKAREYIRAGDIFQVVLSQRFSLPCRENPFNIYRRLRRINPSPYMFYLDFGDLQLVGASPEMLVRVEEGIAQTRPIAGTRPRTGRPEEDEALGRELLADEKERAEHLMLVDLGRNDLGRVCRPGSVKVTEFFQLEHYSHVMHIVSTVQGQVEEGVGPLEVLKAVFPAGTVSGAPKIRAMEIIDELEPVPRGPYAGAVGYLSCTGDMDTCITIRTLWVKDGKVYFQAGAGIVWDSDPRREYMETINKARALLQTVTGRSEFVLLQEGNRDDPHD